MRKLIIAGNWKMNKTISEAVELAKAIKSSDKVNIIVAPPYTALMAVADTGIKTAAQNMHYEDEGAFTGEISSGMVLDAGCKYILVGHSDRRHVFGERDELINKKIKKSLSVGLIPIFCFGELAEEMNSGKSEEVITRQITQGLKDVSVDEMLKMVFAYEPVWAISNQDPTHDAADPVYIKEMHAFVRKILARLYSEDDAKNVVLLYGASMKPANAKALLSVEGVDGGLIGGASLNAESFNELIKIAEEIN